MHQSGVPVAFDWTEYLSLARELASGNQAGAAREARLRSAVSRAYYAAFHRAADLVYTATAAARGFNSHREVIDTLEESDNAQRRWIGSELDRLRGDRKKADYDSAIRNLSKMAENALISAEEIIATIRALPPNDSAV